METSYDSRNSLPGLRGSFLILFQNRSLIVHLTKMELFTKYKRSLLGIFWSFLNPLLTGSVIYFVFGRVFHGYLKNSHGYGVLVFSGILLQALLLQGITVASQAIQSYSSLLTKLRINPIIFSFSSALSHVIHFVLGCIVLIPVALLSHQGFSFRVVILPVYCVLIVFALTGVSLLLSGIFLRFDDAGYLLGALIMIATYLAPIFYPTAILSGKIHMLVHINPISSWINIFRWMLFASNYQFSIFDLVSILLQTLVSITFGILLVKDRWNDYVMLL